MKHGKAILKIAAGLVAGILAARPAFCAEIVGAGAKPAAEKEREAIVHTVAIDPGHQGSWVDMSAQEPMAPGSSEMKEKCTTGTQGNYTGVPEYQLNLVVSLKLKEALLERGYEVVLTRNDNSDAISNSERALLAAEQGGEIFVRIHANSSTDTSINGALAMCMSPQNPYVGDLYEKSFNLSSKIINSYCAQSGFKNLGVEYYDNMTGINWSEVPVMILEMGFMSNESDDRAMEDPATQEKMVKGIADGIDEYFGEIDRAAGVGESADGLIEEMETEFEDTQSALSQGFLAAVKDEIQSREKNAEKWAVSYIDLTDGKKIAYHPHMRMQSASVIKVFIMGTVYERICYPEGDLEQIPYVESYQGELRSTLEKMITVSDNTAANTLITILGEGDAKKGMEVINDFCERHGYHETHVGRLFLESNPTDDNYTSSADCSAVLEAIYKGELVNAEASEKMLSILKGQTVRHKIPAGLPAGYSSANKTGEMPLGYGLGCIENDMAIVFTANGDYVLCVLSNELNGKNEEAQLLIRRISTAAAEEINE